MDWLPISKEAPKLTDWITAFAAFVGIPLSMVAFLKLLRRDKDKDKQIAMLAKQTQELANQTKEFIYQSEQMFESNRILEAQLALQLRVQDERRTLETEKLSLIKQKRLMDIKPNFILRHATLTGYTHMIHLVNKGAEANFITMKFDIQAIEYTAIDNKRASIIKDEVLIIRVGLRNINLSQPYFVNVLFKDQDDNEYLQIINVANVQCDVSNSKLVE